MIKRISFLVLVALFGFLTFAGQAIAGDLDDGKTLLLTNMDVSGARAKFEQALAGNPTGQVENFWCALTEIATNSNLQSLLVDLNVLSPSGAPAIFDAEGEFNYNPESSVENIIIDDGATGYADSGDWVILANPDPDHPYNVNCRSHGSGVGVATWAIGITTPGYYEVYAWIPTSSSNATDAQYTVGANPAVTINQFGYGNADWKFLGNYNLAAGNVVVTLTDNTSTGIVIADAIKLIYQGDVKDDVNAIFQPDENWQAATDVYHAINGAYRIHNGGAGDTATWMFNIPDTSQKYLVYAHWPRIEGGQPASEVEYTVTPYEEFPTTVVLEQLESSREWICLGLYDFTSTTGNKVELASSSEGQVAADAIRIVPSKSYPSLEEGQALLYDDSEPDAGLLANLDNALDNLSQIDNESKDFADVITTAHFSSLTESVYLDYADAKSLETSLHLLKMIFNICVVYDMDSDAYVQQLIAGGGPSFELFFNFLDNYGDLGSPRDDIDTGGFLSEAENGLIDGIGSYFEASEFIRGRSDGLNHFVQFYTDGMPQEEIDQALSIEEEIRNLLSDVEANLADPEHPTFVIPASYANEYGENMGFGTDIEVDLHEFFSDTKDMRLYGEGFFDDDLLHDDFDDPTLGGILPGFGPADWNYLFNRGVSEFEEINILWNGTVPSVELAWDISEDPYAANISQYEIYRAVDPNVDKDSPDTTFVGMINDGSILSFIDTTIGEGYDSAYYYRIYVYYDFGGGDAAESYSSAEKAQIEVYVDANYSGGIENGTKAEPRTSLRDGIRMATRGTKVCVAAGIYNESSSTLPMWNKSGLILEGGYESSGWTRNFAAYETIIDGTGLPYGTIQVYGMSNVVIDGFTVTGAEYDPQQGWYPPSIGIWQSNSIVVKNCKVINNAGSGIQFGDNSTDATIFNNLIYGNGYEGIVCYAGASVSVINNTIVNNAGGGGVRYSSDTTSVEIKNNIIANNNGGWGEFGICGNVSVSADITNNDAYGNVDGNYVSCGTSAGEDGNISQDGLFESGTDGDYYLSQTASGQGTDSPCIDSGSDTAENLGLSGLTTRTDSLADAGTVDMGYHYPGIEGHEMLPFIAADLNGNGMDEVVVDFGDTYGIWVRYDDASWINLHTSSPEYMVKGNLDGDANRKDDLVIDFGDTLGIWICYNDNESWAQLHNISPKYMATADIDLNGLDEVVIDFGSDYGIWVYYPETGNWTQLHSLSSEGIVPAYENGEYLLCIDFGTPYGIWNWHPDTGTWPTIWTQLHSLSPKHGIAADIDNDGWDEGIIDFGDGYGIWVYDPNGGTWTQLHTLSSESITSGNIDGGGDDIIIDFGETYGLWVRYDDGSWEQIHNLNPEWVVTGDLDGNGDDIIIDFGDTYGLWSRYEDSSWEQIHNLSP